MRTTKTDTVGTRLEPAVTARIDRIAERLTETALAGMKVNRADVLRALVLRALPSMERELGMLEAASRAAAALDGVSQDIRKIVNEEGGAKTAKKKTAKRTRGAAR
jgi:hypothetical protein